MGDPRRLRERAPVSAPRGAVPRQMPLTDTQRSPTASDPGPEFDPERAGGHCIVGKATCPGVSAMFFGDGLENDLCSYCWWLTPAGGHVFYHYECYPEVTLDGGR